MSLSSRERAELKFKHAVTERESLANAVVNNRIKLGAGTAWHRGHHCGVANAVETLLEKYPKAAKALSDAYGFDEIGEYSITLS